MKILEIFRLNINQNLLGDRQIDLKASVISQLPHLLTKPVLVLVEWPVTGVGKSC